MKSLIYSTYEYSTPIVFERLLNKHTPEQKYKTTFKNEEKDIVYNF